MREIVLDTETTGFNPETGDRMVEIGAVELINHMPTGRTYHQYINPQRGMPDDAFAIHGIGPDLLPSPRPAAAGEVTLRDKPVFRDVAAAFVDFIGDARLVIHNASFDMKFLNYELTALGYPHMPDGRALDTLTLARKKFPGSPATLDALCRRFGVDNSNREKHGALLDSEILAEVYLELIGGRQPDFGLSNAALAGDSTLHGQKWRPPPRPRPLPARITAAEAEAHAAFIKQLGDEAIWLKR